MKTTLIFEIRFRRFSKSKDTKCLQWQKEKLGLDDLASHPRLLPHLIILDLLMPVMGEREFVSYHEKNAKPSKIPVIVLSALQQQKARAAALRLG